VTVCVPHSLIGIVVGLAHAFMAWWRRMAMCSEFDIKDFDSTVRLPCDSLHNTG
jgi:hypothetical protein